MPGFVITAVFAVDSGRIPLGPGVLAQTWGIGHQFSYCDGRSLTLVVEVRAADSRTAFEAALSRAEQVWQAAGYGRLGAPTTVQVQSAVAPQPVPAGAPSRSDRLRARARWFADRRHLLDGVDLASWHGWPWTGSDDGRDGPDDRPDDGGLAGVREPRRPKPGPPSLSVVRDPDDDARRRRPGDLTDASGL